MFPMNRANYGGSPWSNLVHPNLKMGCRLKSKLIWPFCFLNDDKHWRNNDPKELFTNKIETVIDIFSRKHFITTKDNNSPGDLTV